MRVEARAREVTVNTRDFNASKTVFDARHARERKIPRTIPPTADRRPWRDAARRARADDEETATRTHRECIKQTDLELARDAIAAACAGRRAHTRDVQTTGGGRRRVTNGRDRSQIDRFANLWALGLSRSNEATGWSSGWRLNGVERITD